MIPQFNSIVLDVVVIAILIALLAVGVFKGLKHTFINTILLLMSIAVGFMPYTEVVKASIVNVLSGIIDVQNIVSLTTEMKMGVSMLYMFMAAVILSLLVYILLRLIKLVIVTIIHKRNQKPHAHKKKILSRIAGGLVNLVVGGVLVIIALSLANNPLIGLDKTLKETYVTKYIEEADDLLVKELKKDPAEIEGYAMLIAIKGDFLVVKDVEDEDIENLNHLLETLGHTTIVPGTFDETNAQAVVNNFYYILSLQEKFLYNEDTNERVPGYEDFFAISVESLTKAVSKIESLHMGTDPDNPNEPIDGIEKTMNVHQKLSKICGVTTAKKFANVFTLG